MSEPTDLWTPVMREWVSENVWQHNVETTKSTENMWEKDCQNHGERGRWTAQTWANKLKMKTKKVTKFRVNKNKWQHILRQQKWQRKGEKIIDRTKVSETRRNGLTEQDWVRGERLIAQNWGNKNDKKIQLTESEWEGKFDNTSLRQQERWRQRSDTGRGNETFYFDGCEQKTTSKWKGKVGSPTSEIYTDNNMKKWNSMQNWKREWQIKTK